MSNFGITCPVEEGLGNSFDVTSGDTNFVGINLVNVSVKEDVSVTTFVIPSKIMSKHPEFNACKISTNHNLAGRRYK